MFHVLQMKELKNETNHWTCLIYNFAQLNDNSSCLYSYEKIIRPLRQLWAILVQVKEIFLWTASLWCPLKWVWKLMKYYWDSDGGSAEEPGHHFQIHNIKILFICNCNYSWNKTCQQYNTSCLHIYNCPTRCTKFTNLLGLHKLLYLYK